MSNPTTKTRVASAFLAMKQLGISEDKVKPVLKKLVRLYEKKWELIEAEQYRALIDAIFESEETEANDLAETPPHNHVAEPLQEIESIEREDARANMSNNAGQVSNRSKKILSNEEENETEDEAPERPLKRLRRRNQDGQTSSQQASGVAPTPLIKPKKVPGALKIAEDVKVQTQAAAAAAAAAEGPSFHNNKGKQPITQNPSTERRPVTESSTLDVCPQGPKAEHGIVLSPKQNMSGRPVVIQPENKPITDAGQLSEACLEVIHPDCNGMDGRSHQDAVDVAKGQENLVITLTNDVNTESPLFFQYIAKNIIFEDAKVNVSLGRIDSSNCCSCLKDCLSSKTPCNCSSKNGGAFAYTEEGLVKEELLDESISMNQDPKKHTRVFCEECPVERSKNEVNIEPCKGHLVRKFIKECWVKCGCNKKLCGNRVVQRGISRKLQVFMTSEGKGWGLRTLENLPKGAFACEYVGEVLTTAELFDNFLQKPEELKQSSPVLLDADWSAQKVLKDESALCLDATYYGNVARFINHRCYDPNMVVIPVEVETPDHHYYHHALFTTREVKAMEELTWDYGIDFGDLGHPIKPFRCQCGSMCCRDIVSQS